MSSVDELENEVESPSEPSSTAAKPGRPKGKGVTKASTPNSKATTASATKGVSKGVSRNGSKAVAPATATAPRPARVKENSFGEYSETSIRHCCYAIHQAQDPTRMSILLILDGAETNVGDICRQVSQSQPAVSHHLSLLRSSRTVGVRREGKNNFYSLTQIGHAMVKGFKSIHGELSQLNIES